MKRELTDEFFEDLILLLAVVTFKEEANHEHIVIKSETENTEENEEKGDGFAIPEFVYVFYGKECRL